MSVLRLTSEFWASDSFVLSAEYIHPSFSSSTDFTLTVHGGDRGRKRLGGEGSAVSNSGDI